MVGRCAWFENPKDSKSRHWNKLKAMPPHSPRDRPPETSSWDEAVTEPEARSGLLPEFVRKMAVAGLGALFMTEEGIRNLAGQLKLPKEVLAFVLSQADRTKDELGRVISEEVRKFLQSDRLREEFLKVLAGTTLEIKAQLRLTSEPDAKGPAKLEVAELKLGRRKLRKSKTSP